MYKFDDAVRSPQNYEPVRRRRGRPKLRSLKPVPPDNYDGKELVWIWRSELELRLQEI
jgi:hypothetical protein